MTCCVVLNLAALIDPSSSGSIQANNPSRDSVGVSYKVSRGSEAGERGRMEGSRHRRARRSTFPERDLGASWRRGVWRNARDDRRAGRGRAGAKIRRGPARGALFDDDHPADDARERVSLQQNEIDSGRHSPAVAVPGVPGHGMGPRGERSLVQQAETAPGAIVDGEAVMSLSGEMEAHPGTGSGRVGNDAKGNRQEGRRRHVRDPGMARVPVLGLDREAKRRRDVAPFHELHRVGSGGAVVAHEEPRETFAPVAPWSGSAEYFQIPPGSSDTYIMPVSSTATMPPG